MMRLLQEHQRNAERSKEKSSTCVLLWSRHSAIGQLYCVVTAEICLHLCYNMTPLEGKLAHLCSNYSCVVLQILCTCVTCFSLTDCLFCHSLILYRNCFLCYSNTHLSTFVHNSYYYLFTVVCVVLWTHYLFIYLNRYIFINHVKS